MADNKKPQKPVGKSATKPTAKVQGRPLVQPKTPPVRAADVLKGQGGMPPMKIKGGLFGRKGGPRRGGGK